MGEILFMGPKTSGKSLLLKRMEMLCDEKRVTPFDAMPSTKPTEGVESNMFKFRGMNFIFKELGGSVIGDWEAHARAPKAIVYVFDAADYTRTASNIVWLNKLLTAQQFEQKPVLVVLNKCDVPNCVRFNVIDEIIGFDRVLNRPRVAFLEASAVVGVGLKEIFQWISEHMK